MRLLFDKSFMQPDDMVELLESSGTGSSTLKSEPMYLSPDPWFVIYPLWFVNAAFCTSQHTTTVKNTRQIITFA